MLTTSENNIFGSQVLLATLDHINDAVVLTDSANTVIFFNRAAEKLWSYPRSVVLGRKTEAIPLFRTDTLPAQGNPLTIISSRGVETPLAATVSELPFSDVGTRRMIVVHVDRERVARLSSYNSLTGLPKRCALHKLVDQLIADGPQQGIALFSLDLDHFKDVNDALSYAAGDQVLTEIAQRLNIAFSHEAYVSHVDSDAFVLAVPDCDQSRAMHIVRQIQMLFRMPFNVAGLALHVSASTGISLYPEHGETCDRLLRLANHASHLAKASSSGGYLFFSSEMNQIDQERLKLAAALKLAIPNNHMHLHYQPQVWLKNGELYGVEALARSCIGRDPARKVYYACRRNGGDRSDWTLHEACR